MTVFIIGIFSSIQVESKWSHSSKGGGSVGIFDVTNCFIVAEMSVIAERSGSSGRSNSGKGSISKLIEGNSEE